jgi:hypothetical protein
LIQRNAGRFAAPHKAASGTVTTCPTAKENNDMRPSLPLLAAALLACSALPALATPCGQQVSALQRRLDSVGAVRVAGLEPGHTLTTGSVKALPRALAESPSDPQLKPTRENVAAARLLILEAQAEDQEGNQRACENILTDAKRLIGALP